MLTSGVGNSALLSRSADGILRAGTNDGRAFNWRRRGSAGLQDAPGHPADFLRGDDDDREVIGL